MVPDNMEINETNRRTYIKTLAGGVGAIGLAGCGGSSGDGSSGDGSSGDGSSGDGSNGGGGDGFPVTITLGAGPLTLDPHNHSAAETYSALLSCYEPLTHSTREGEVIPRIATDWERIDELTMRFDIRKNVKFHNGDTLTPEDVVFSVRRVADPNFGITSPQQDAVAHVTPEVADEGHAVIFETETPDPILPARVGLGSSPYVMNKEWTQARSEGEIGREANGTGPYVVTDFRAKQYIELRRFDDWWDWEHITNRELPDVTHGRFQGAAESSTRAAQLLADETDLINAVAPTDFNRIENANNARLITGITDRYEFCKMKPPVEPYDSLEFRQALNYAVNLEEMAEALFNGSVQITGQPTPPTWFGYNPNVEPYPYDPGKAEDLVDESGYAGVKLNLHTAVGHRANDLEAAQAVAGYIGDLTNVDCTVTEHQFSELFSKLRGPIKPKPAFTHGTTGGSPADAVAGKMERMFHAEGSGTKWRNEKVTRLIDKASKTLDVEKRRKISMKLNRVIHDLAPDIFMWFRSVGYGASNRIGFKPRTDQNLQIYTIKEKQ